MQPPSVVIVASPYEAELCRRALVETGLRVVVVDAPDDEHGVIAIVRSERPLVLVVGLGLFGVEAVELVRSARAEQPALAIFLLGDREGQPSDEDQAVALGATRLFLRPIEVEALADAIEKRAVEAEVAGEVAEAMAEFDVRPPTIDAAPLVEESIVEIEADYGHGEAPPTPLARLELKRVPRETTEVMKGVIEVPAAAARVHEEAPGKVEATLEMDAAPEIEPPADPPPRQPFVATGATPSPSPVAAASAAAVIGRAATTAAASADPSAGASS